jgi:hypothetical protein
VITGASGATSTGSTGSSSTSAGGGTSQTCEALEMAAVKQFEAVVDRNLACSVDADCTELNVGPSGYCAAPCGALTNEAGAQAAESAANDACQPFLAAGCKPPILQCPAFPPFLCAGGTCATYSVQVTTSPLPTFTHGVCTALHLAYSTQSGSPPATQAISVLMQSSIGTLYADPACTTPVTTGTLTIPAGSSGVDFGFVPAAAGSGWLDVGSGIGGAEYEITVQ